MILTRTTDIPTFTGKLPWITTKQMIEVDRLMIEEYGIELIQMMENAGRGLALLAKKRFLMGSHKKVIVLTGTGGNGGGAMVAARRLAAWGYEVHVVVTNPERLTPIPQHQFDILQKMKVSIGTVEQMPADDVGLIIDGIIGYSLNGAPSGEPKKLIEWANEQGKPVLALDTPSGIDLTSGTIYDPVIKANATLTLALPKKGLADDKVKKYRGELYLADISVPPDLYAHPSLALTISSPFESGDVVRID